MLPEVKAAGALALLGSASWPFAAQELPLHYGQGAYDNFVPSWVALIALPWTLAAGVAYLANFPRYRARQGLRVTACLLVFGSLAGLLLSLAYEWGT